MEKKKEKLNRKEKIDDFIAEWFAVVFMVGGFAIIAVFAVKYYNNFYNTILTSEDVVQSLGQAGDFSGGLLNPIFAFLSYCLLLITIKLQNKSLKTSREELKLTREELARSANAQEKQIESIKIQNFETTFFNLLNFHNKIVDNFNFKKYKFKYFNEKIFFYKNDVHDIFYKEEAFNEICKQIDMISNDDKLNFTKFNEVYDLYYNENEHLLCKYFDNINQIFKFISDSIFDDKEQKKYSDIFRIQFSQYELKLLFYHCIGSNNSSTLRSYIEKFNFFEFLILEEDNKNFIYIFSKNIYENVTFGNNYLKIARIVNAKKEYLETKKPDFQNIEYSSSFIRNEIDEIIEYCSYSFIFEKYNLLWDTIDKLEKYLLDIQSKNPAINSTLRINAANDLNKISNIKRQIKKYL